jgi:hypothetical protein
MSNSVLNFSIRVDQEHRNDPLFHEFPKVAGDMAATEAAMLSSTLDQALAVEGQDGVLGLFIPQLLKAALPNHPQVLHSDLKLGLDHSLYEMIHSIDRVNLDFCLGVALADRYCPKGHWTRQAFCAEHNQPTVSFLK